jgi:bifunctional UDP-N-acetylglucosamine pyrophosphorylase/glucosamine-1-phosphate N-acetyltransferase
MIVRLMLLQPNLNLTPGKHSLEDAGRNSMFPEIKGCTMTRKNITALVLAAGLGTRMKSTRAKVLHEVLFKPMLLHVLDTIRSLGLDHTYVIVGHQREKVAELVAPYEATCITQDEQLGTGHAVLCAEDSLGGASGTVLILSGDVPLVRAESLRAMLTAHTETMPALTLMTATLDNPANYGRIRRDSEGCLLEIVEEKDADATEKAIQEINAGIYCVDTSFLFKALRKVGTDNKQGEVYLTDIVKIGIALGLQIETFSGAGGAELLGINSRSELAAANRYLQHRKNSELMTGGVSLLDPETIFIQQEVTIGADTVIHANVQVSGNSTIGSGCTVGPDVVLHRCTVGNNVTIGPFSNLSGFTVRDNEVIAPHSSLVRA